MKTSTDTTDCRSSKDQTLQSYVLPLTLVEAYTYYLLS